jgi:putative transposase
VSRRPPRLAPSLYVGLHAYFVTICCHQRRRVLVDAESCDLILLQLRRTADACAFAVLAYCLMPDHAHIVAEGTDERSDLLEFIRAFKQRTEFTWKRARRTSLWQESFYDHVLRHSENTRSAVRYALENPVRAGLVASPGDYPFSGSLLFTRSALIEWAYQSNGGVMR